MTGKKSSSMRISLEKQVFKSKIHAFEHSCTLFTETETKTQKDLKFAGWCIFNCLVFVYYTDFCSTAAIYFPIH